MQNAEYLDDVGLIFNGMRHDWHAGHAQSRAVSLTREQQGFLPTLIVLTMEARLPGIMNAHKKIGKFFSPEQLLLRIGFVRDMLAYYRALPPADQQLPACLQERDQDLAVSTLQSWLKTFCKTLRCTSLGRDSWQIMKNTFHRVRAQIEHDRQAIARRIEEDERLLERDRDVGYDLQDEVDDGNVPNNHFMAGMLHALMVDQQAGFAVNQLAQIVAAYGGATPNLGPASPAQVIVIAQPSPLQGNEHHHQPSPAQAIEAEHDDEDDLLD